MIPEAAVEAAEEYLSLLMADPNGDYTMEARTLLEAAAPYMAPEQEVVRDASGERVRAAADKLRNTLDERLGRK